MIGAASGGAFLKRLFNVVYPPTGLQVGFRKLSAALRKNGENDSRVQMLLQVRAARCVFHKQLASIVG